MNKLTIYRKPMGESLFDEEFTVEALSQMGNPLERLSSLVDLEMFRPVLEGALLTKECKTPARASGNKYFDDVQHLFDYNHISSISKSKKKNTFCLPGYALACPLMSCPLVSKLPTYMSSKSTPLRADILIKYPHSSG